MPYKVTVAYDNNQFIPGPRVRFERVLDRSPDGTVRNKKWRITLNGWTDAIRGSPKADSSTWTSDDYPPDETATSYDKRIAQIRGKIKGLAEVFAQDGRLFSITPADNSTAITARVRWGNLQVPEGNWIHGVEWTIEGEAASISPFDDESNINGLAEETWSLERTDESGRVYLLTHVVSAVGNITYKSDGTIDQQAWEVAKARVLAAIGYVNARLTGDILSLAGFTPHNRKRLQNVDTAAGRFSITETWVCVDPSDIQSGVASTTNKDCTEEIVVEDHFDVDTGLNTVTVSVSVAGLEKRNMAGSTETDTVVASRWESAADRLGKLTKEWAVNYAQTETSLTLNPDPRSYTTSRNKTNGTGSINYVFDTRPGTSNTNYLNEVIAIDFDNGGSVVAKIPVPFRAPGPILQDLSTVTEKSVTIQHDIKLRPQYGSILTAPTTNPTALALAAIGVTPTKFFLVSDRPRFVPRDGTYSRTTTFLYQ